MEPYPADEGAQPPTAVTGISGAIVRVRKTTNYATILNAPLRDHSLSWKARGLLAFLLSMPDNWQVQIEHLATQSPEGKTAVRSGLKELEGAGYLIRRRIRGEGGRMAGWESILYETPGHTESGFSEVGSPDVRLTEHEERTTEPKNDLEEEKPSSPTARIERLGEFPVPLWEQAFEMFWEPFPRKAGKKLAKDKFRLALKKVESPQVLIDASIRYAADPNLPETQFIPHAATWLNQERWNDPPLPSRTDLRRTTDDKLRSGVAAAAEVIERHKQQEQGAIGGGR